MRELYINNNEAGQRFDKFLKKYLNKAPSSFLYKMLRKKNITLNGKKDDGSTVLKLNDKVNIYICEESICNFIEEVKADIRIDNSKNISLDIVYEDNDIIIINKPVGMLAQKADSKDISANEYIINYLLESGQISKADLQTFKPSVCNRLDRNTSGLLVAGKSLMGLQNMSKAFKERSLHKYYLCVVNGVVENRQLIKGYLSKDEKSNKVRISTDYFEGGQAIETEYIPVDNNGKFSLMMINLVTGKPHQIRAHLAFIGHPIIGDYKYGDNQVNDYFKKNQSVSFQLLHAYKLILEDGRTFTANVPEIFENVLRTEKLSYGNLEY